MWDLSGWTASAACLYWQTARVGFPLRGCCAILTVGKGDNRADKDNNNMTDEYHKLMNDCQHMNDEGRISKQNMTDDCHEEIGGKTATI